MSGRRDLGSRRPVKQGLQRPYTRTYACMGCHETRKRVVDYPDYPDSLPCPTCGGEALYMSHRFRAPPKDDDGAWAVIEAVARAGFRYFPVGEDYPTRMSEVRGFAERQAGRLRKPRPSRDGT